MAVGDAGAASASVYFSVKVQLFGLLSDGRHGGLASSSFVLKVS